ncbi:MAG: protease inhibitor I42 family protein [Vulcanibacillus sp.]
MNDSKKPIIFISLLLIFVLIGAVTFFLNDSNFEAKTEVNQTIVLEENPTTGFTWQYIIKDTSVVQIISDSYKPNEGNEDIVGGGGVHTWILKGLKEGTTTIKFDHYRPWEGIDKSIESVTYSVKVSSDLEITEIVPLL